MNDFALFQHLNAIPGFYGQAVCKLSFVFIISLNADTDVLIRIVQHIIRDGATQQCVRDLRHPQALRGPEG